MQDASVYLWATDEVHFQQHGSRCRMWIPPEIKDPVLLHAPTRKCVGYFGAVRLRDGRFVLDFLPPYSPELNPIERVWKLTRRRCLHNRYFENLKDIISAVETEFANWTRRNDVLRRLCAIT